MKIWAERLISAFKWLLALFMILAGILTMFTPLTPMSGVLGYIYSTRISLVIFGIIFSSCGGMLLYGKMRRSRVWTGRGLMGIYLCFTFATLLQGVAYGWHPGYWANNLIMALITGALWLRWRLKTAYIDPRHFYDEPKHK